MSKEWRQLTNTLLVMTFFRKRFLLPHRVWVRILCCNVLYVLLLILVYKIVVALDERPPDAMFWLSDGLYVAGYGWILFPLVQAISCVAALHYPHRNPLSIADYIALILSYLSLIGLTVFNFYSF